MDNIHIRLGTRDDLDALAEIEIRAASLFPEDRIPQPPQSLPYFVLSEAISQQLLFSAEKKTELVGFASCELYADNNKHYLHLDEISVDPSYGKQGIGSLLLKHIIKESRNRNVAGITLTTFEDFSWNAPFYIKRGFQILSNEVAPKHVQTILQEESELGLISRCAMFYKNTLYKSI